MSNLETALIGAAEAGIITRNQADTLFSYLRERNVPLDPAEGMAASSGTREDDVNPLEDTEAPRFVRGFHDILITIGIIVLLVGLRGLFSIYVQLPVIIVLVEILVRRQRLALPAVVLTLWLVYWIGTVVVAHHALGDFDGLSALAAGMLMLLPFPPLLGLFYWRYRVPLSLAAVLLSLFALAVTGIFYLIGVPFLIGGVSDPAHPQGASPFLTLCILFGAALAMFAVAMYFDLKDPRRVTRNSDVAFWMHLATAPALLYTTIMLVFWLQIDKAGADPGLLFPSLDNYSRAPVIVAIVLILMFVGVIIDRRAFVTSGLVSLGVAIVSILRQSQAQVDTAGFAALLLVGLFVLMIGVGWPHLRRAIVGRLPLGIQTKLPALR
ncbi:hypothetical protein [Rhizobium sp. BK376]|uniref:hypothetical protein n=1 Tax=Rhizobium sp. BK376 TaxID=2512149 RepID=UPI001043789C|nr:hypothetical protein [Rhizobium sp. BK376]TCR92169.1 hypothetical protein EV561_102614 [Rhizobium sp. BK376]